MKQQMTNSILLYYLDSGISLTFRYKTRGSAVSRINNFMGHLSRHGLNGKYSSEVVQGINKRDEIVYFVSFYLKEEKE